MTDLHLSIRKSSIWMVVRLGISLTAGAFVTTFIIRTLSVKDYGVYNVLYCLIGYVSMIGSFGIPSVFGRFIPEALQKKEYSLLRALILRGLILRVLLSTAIVGIILLLHGPIGHLLKLDGFLDYFCIMAFGIVMSLEASLLTNVLHSLFLHKYSVIASTINTIFRGTCVFVLLKLGWGIPGVLWAEVASWTIWTFIQLFFYYLKFLRLHPDKANKSALPLRRYFRYGSLAIFNKVGGTILGTSTDFFIITAFLGPGAVALYAFADRVIKIFGNFLPHVVLLDVITPSFMVKYSEKGNKQVLNDMFNLLVKVAAFSVFPFAAGMLLLGDKMILIIFKPDYLAAEPIIWILVGCLVVNIIVRPANLVLQALEKIEVNLYSKIFAVYNLIVELAVIQCFGVMGVALVTASASLMNGLFLYYFAKKYGSLSLDWRGLSVIAVNTVVMAAAIWPLRSFATGSASLALVAIGGIATYLLLSWVHKAFNSQESKLFTRCFPGSIS